MNADDTAGAIALEPVGTDDAAAFHAQLGRPVRDPVGVAHRCPCGNPDVVATSPRLSDGTPFPTFLYLTCPKAASAIGTLEAGDVMPSMRERLSSDPGLAARHRAAHDAYVAARESFGSVPEIAGVSAGGMPDRVKCLHALAAHSLAAGPGVNPLGDETLELIGPWWRTGPCVGPLPADDGGGPQ